MEKIIGYLLISCFLYSCNAPKKTLSTVTEVFPITLDEYYLYEIEFKNIPENYYGLIISKNKYDNVNAKKIINSGIYYLVDKVSFYTYFDMKQGEYSIDDFQDCKKKIDYREDFLNTIENDKEVINVFKISGEFYFRKTYSGWYNDLSTVNLDISKSKSISVIYPICD